MATKKADRAANLAAVLATETAANTLSYARFAFPFSIMDKVGLVIQRLEYWIQGLGNFNSTGDSVSVGLIAASTIVNIGNQADPALLDSVSLGRLDLGVAASGGLVVTPMIKDFANLPGGGILVAPNPLSIAIMGAGCAGPMAAWVRMWYTYIEMSTDEYWELVESRRIIST